VAATVGAYRRFDTIIDGTCPVYPVAQLITGPSPIALNGIPDTYEDATVVVKVVVGIRIPHTWTSLPTLV
jgi:hypothetical protein